VTGEWLRASARAGKPLPCGKYAALRELEQETQRNCPDRGCTGYDTDDEGEGETSGRSSRCQGCMCKYGGVEYSVSVPTQSPSSPMQLVSSTPPTSPSSIRVPRTSTTTNLVPPHPLPPTPFERLNHKSQYTVQRASPLTCVNQSLVEELDIVRRSRYLEGRERSALSYARAGSAIKGELYRRLIALFFYLPTRRNSLSGQDKILVPN
jgi:DNA polymerase IV